MKIIVKLNVFNNNFVIYQTSSALKFSIMLSQMIIQTDC